MLELRQQLSDSEEFTGQAGLLEDAEPQPAELAQIQRNNSPSLSTTDEQGSVSTTEWISFPTWRRGSVEFLSANEQQLQVSMPLKSDYGPTSYSCTHEF